MQSYWLITAAVVFLILIIPIFVKIYASFDILQNTGVLKLKIFFINVLNYKIKFVKNHIVFYTEKNKKDIEVEVSDKQLLFIKKFINEIVKKVVIRSIVFKSEIGLNDAMKTALANGFVNAIVNTSFAVIKNEKKSANMYILNNPKYNSYSFFCSCNMGCFSSLFDILYALILSIISLKRERIYRHI